MIEVIGITIGLAFVDCLNPATIGTMAVLLPLVKRVEDSLFFLFSTYLVYFAGGMALYYGFDRFLRNLISPFLDQHRFWINNGEILLGLILAGIGIFLLIKNRHAIQNRTTDLTSITGLKSVQPSYLFVFGVISTLSDLPTALPFIGFIGKMVDLRPTFVTLFLLMVVYVFIYVAPLIALYGIFHAARDKLQSITGWFINFTLKFTNYVLPLLLIGLGVWGILDGIQRLELG